MAIYYLTTDAHPACVAWREIAHLRALRARFLQEEILVRPLESFRLDDSGEPGEKSPRVILSPAASEKEGRELFPEAVVLDGLERLVEENPWPRAGTKGVLFPGAIPSVTALRAFHQIRVHASCLYVATGPEAFLPELRPGHETLCLHAAPQVLPRAVVSASFLVTGDRALALYAVAKGVPAWLLPGTERAGCPLPFFDENAPEAISQVNDYPWPRLRDWLEAERARLETHLFPQKIAAPAAVAEREMSTLRIACVTDFGYLPHFLGLMENLDEVHGGRVIYHVLALDDEVMEYLRREFPLRRLVLYRLSDLWSAEELTALSRRSVADLAYSSKARLLRAALRREAAPLFYVDLDLFFFRSPVSLLGELAGGSVLLFPQWNEHLFVSKFYGVFNAGLLAVAPGAETFLEWWAYLCLHHYNRDVRAGYFVDQGLLDLAPIYFEAVRIYRGGDENVASWNLRTLGWKQVQSLPGSFHAAREDARGFFSLKVAWDQAVSFFSALNIARQPERFPALGLLVLQQQRALSLRARRGHFLLRLFEVGWGRFPSTALCSPWWMRFFVEGTGFLLDGLMALHRVVRAGQRFSKRLCGRTLPEDGGGAAVHHAIRSRSALEASA